MSKTKIDDVVQTIQVGPVIIKIMRGCTPDGYPYLYYQPGLQTSRQAFAWRFYDRDEKDLSKAIQEASQWIRRNPQAANVDWQPEPTKEAA